MDEQLPYTYTAIRRAVEQLFQLREAAARSEYACVVYLDISRALSALPEGLRQRLWWMLVMDGQHKLAAVYVQDMIKGPVRRMQRFLNPKEVK